MPFYRYLCICGATVTLRRSMHNRNAPAYCAACGERMKLTIAEVQRPQGGDTPIYHGGNS